MSFRDNLIYHKSKMEGQKTRVAREIIKQLESILPSIYKISSEINNSNINKKVLEIKKIIDEKFDSLSPDLQKYIFELGLYESEFQKALLESSLLNESATVLQSVNQNALKTAIFSTPIEGLLFKDGLKRLNSDVKNQVETAIRVGFLNGETAKQIERRIRGNYTITQNRMVSFIRTSIQSAANTSTVETYKKNEIEKVEYCAILDSRTTKICKSLNGKVFDINKAKLPPQHYNCRSFIIPVLKDVDFEVNKNYSEWLVSSKTKDLNANEKGDFQESFKDVTSLNQLREKEEKRLNQKIG